MERRRIMSVVIVALAASGFARADMTPFSGWDAGGPPVAQACNHAEPVAPQSSLAMVDLGLPLPGFSIGPKAGQQAAGGPQSPCVLKDEQDSLGLCLYALLGLGLCKSAPLVRKVSLGAIPSWYHDGGPCQIGHSFAISPDCLSPVSVYCFVQPDRRDENPSPRYRRRGTVSLWRESQFTLSVLASRGPPHLAHESFSQ
jgi:hypothetical protein